MLDLHTDADAQNPRWVHNPGAAADHDPEPVLWGEVEVDGRCDLCFAADPTWVIPARDFEIVPGQHSMGYWSACEICTGYIRMDRWNMIRRRAAENWESRHNLPVGRDKLTAFDRIFRLLRKNIIGAPMPLDEAFHRAVHDTDFGRGLKTMMRSWGAQES